MKTTAKIATATLLFAAIALPAFAGDQELATSGRIVGHHAGPMGGSMWMMHQRMHGDIAPALRDFQLEGRQ